MRKLPILKVKKVYSNPILIPQEADSGTDERKMQSIEMSIFCIRVGHRSLAKAGGFYSFPVRLHTSLLLYIQ